MSELSKQADALLAPERARVDAELSGYRLPPAELSGRAIALGHALATLALVQATEAQTKAIEQQTAAILKAGKR